MKVIYVHSMIERIGHLSEEMFILRNLYDANEFEVTVITYPPHLIPRTNKALYDIVMRGINVEHSIDANLIYLKHRNRNIPLTQNGDFIYVLLPIDKLRIEFYKKFRDNKPSFYFSLSDSDLERGIQLRDSFNIPRTAPIVTLHVRDVGYFPEDPTGVSDDYRNATIENYIPAINYLIDEGFYIVRLGDKSMRPINIESPQVVDAPFHPSYTDFVEPYFIAVSNFYIGVESGPLSTAQGFGIPVLITNSTLNSALWSFQKDLILPKKYYSHKLRRHLTYEEIILSPAIDFYRSHFFKQSGIELVENSPEEILMAVKEMNERLNGTYSTTEKISKINERVRKIQEKADYIRQHTISPEIIPYCPGYLLYWSSAQISHEFIKANPGFLGHDWPRVEEWGAEPKLALD